MLIGAYAIGARHAYIYCRAEYPLAIEQLNRGIAQAKEYGLLGENILGSGFSLDFVIKQGAGAFVCGEETALMHSIEGKRGMPTPRPPFPAQSGVFGKPSNINNVETWANVPLIINRGADWFAGIGTREVEGHEGVRARRLRQQHRPRRGADGHDAAHDRRGHRRRDAARPQVQGGADRRTVGRLHPGGAHRHRRWTTSRCRRSARSWAPAASW